MVNSSCLWISILFGKNYCLDNGHGLVQLISGNSDFHVGHITTILEINLGFMSIRIILYVPFFYGHFDLAKDRKADEPTFWRACCFNIPCWLIRMRDKELKPATT